MKKIYFLNHSPINVYFAKNADNFSVNEIPLYPFSNDGEHLVLHVRKKELTTWDMLKILSKKSGARMREFGYAGLKDKEGITTQYISIHKKYEKPLKDFSHEKIKILDFTYHKNKIKIGHLKGNRFFIRFKKVSYVDSQKLIFAIEELKKEGFPNYFGYQRFGKDKNNANKGLALLQHSFNVKDKKMKKFFISAYQSELFNSWLERRIEISKLIQEFSPQELIKIFSWDINYIKNIKKQKHFFKIFDGDIMHHYPHGKAFICEDIDKESHRFYNKESVPTGWIVGAKTIQSENRAKEIESSFFNEAIQYIDAMNGSRRYAWSFLENVQYIYKEEKAWFEINFTLQKGSYATVIVDEIIKYNNLL